MPDRYISLTDRGKDDKISGGYIRTDEFRERMSEMRKGRKLSEEHKRKISESKKGKPNKCKGFKMSKEAIEKIRRASTGRRHSEESKQKLREHRLGKTMSDETKAKIKASLVGSNNKNWRGGRAKSNGYILIHSPEHPYKNGYGYVFEHRLVMEKHIGRYLSPEEIVHHINGKITDNRIENLMLFASHREHALFHVAQKNKNNESFTMEGVQ